MNFEDFSINVSSGQYDEIEELYRSLEEDILKRIFVNYPNIEFEKIELSFSIGKTVKHTALLHLIIEKLPNKLVLEEINDVHIEIKSEEDFLNNLVLIHDIWTLVKNWKSSLLTVDNNEIKTQQEFYLLSDRIGQKNNKKIKYFNKTVKELEKEYNTRKTKKSNIYEGEKEKITRDCIVDALESVINKYIEIYGMNKEIINYEASSNDKVIVVENSLVVDFRVMPKYWARMDDDQFEDWEYPYIVIQEMTHNDLFKFNFADFKRRFIRERIGLDFLPYHGMNYYRAEVDNYNKINELLPQLNLQKRYENYAGELHHFVIFRIEGANGEKAYGVGETKKKIHPYVLKVCKELEEKNSRSLLRSGLSSVGAGKFTEDFYKAFLSWEGQKKNWRLENKLTYFYEDIMVKEDTDLFYIPNKILKKAIDGFYDNEEFGTYKKPTNRWKSEELVYNITKKLFKDYQVIYQYRPYYLNTENGCMSYDIYICGLKVAIEYQGKQHFEPVDYFGGEENYRKQVERDKLKAERSKENGVKLVYVNYWEDITPELIKEKIGIRNYS